MIFDAILKLWKQDFTKDIKAAGKSDKIRILGRVFINHVKNASQ